MTLRMQKLPVCVCVFIACAARYIHDNPEAIIAGSAVAVIFCMFIVVVMVILLIKRWPSVLYLDQLLKKTLRFRRRRLEEEQHI